jgi:hypothetical protein
MSVYYSKIRSTYSIISCNKVSTELDCQWFRRISEYWCVNTYLPRMSLAKAHVGLSKETAQWLRRISE